MREDIDCEEFLDFSKQYGEEISISILEDICGRETWRTWPFQIIGLRHESHDREGNNVTLTGDLKFRAKAWSFTIKDGNMNGTEVVEWERTSLSPCYEIPAQSLWMFSSIQTFVVRMLMEGQMMLMTEQFERLKAGGGKV